MESALQIPLFLGMEMGCYIVSGIVGLKFANLLFAQLRCESTRDSKLVISEVSTLC